MSNERLDWVNHETPDLSSAPFIAVKFLLGLRLGFIFGFVVEFSVSTLSQRSH